MCEPHALKCCHGVQTVPTSDQGGAMIWVSASMLPSVACRLCPCLTRGLQQCRPPVIRVSRVMCCHGVHRLAQVKACHLPVQCCHLCGPPQLTQWPHVMPQDACRSANTSASVQASVHAASVTNLDSQHLQDEDRGRSTEENRLGSALSATWGPGRLSRATSRRSVRSAHAIGQSGQRTVVKLRQPDL